MRPHSCTQVYAHHLLSDTSVVFRWHANFHADAWEQPSAVAVLKERAASLSARGSGARGSWGYLAGMDQNVEGERDAGPAAGLLHESIFEGAEFAELYAATQRVGLPVAQQVETDEGIFLVERPGNGIEFWRPVPRPPKPEPAEGSAAGSPTANSPAHSPAHSPGRGGAAPPILRRGTDLDTEVPQPAKHTSLSARRSSGGQQVTFLRPSNDQRTQRQAGGEAHQSRTAGRSGLDIPSIDGAVRAQDRLPHMTLRAAGKGRARFAGVPEEGTCESEQGLPAQHKILPVLTGPSRDGPGRWRLERFHDDVAREASDRRILQRRFSISRRGKRAVVVSLAAGEIIRGPDGKGSYARHQALAREATTAGNADVIFGLANVRAKNAGASESLSVH